MIEEIITEGESAISEDTPLTDRIDGGEEIPTEESEPTDAAPFDYGEEVAAIEEAIPELRGRIAELEGNIRYAELRALGLTPREAYLVTSRPEARADNRSHLTASVPKFASAPTFGMSRDELAAARSVFEDLDDGEIRRLYKKVTR